MELKVYRNAVEVARLPIDGSTVFTQKLMVEHKIVGSTIVPSPLGLQIGDYVAHDGERFYLNIVPAVEKINNFTYSYDFVFEGEVYYLYNKLFIDEGLADFNYHGSPVDFIDLLLTNINSTQSGWTKATIEDAEARTLSFSNDSCRTALTKIAEAFGMEYRLAGKSIYLQKTVGFDTTLRFEYGRGKGLYTLSRNSIDEKSLVTRVFGFGARKNLGPDYRDGSSRLVFEERYLDKNTSLYGIREGSVTFDDVFPQRTGTISAIDPGNRMRFVDISLNFDINTQLIEGTTAKVVFKTGALAGYQFEIKSYLNSSKTIEILPFSEENGYTLPNSLNFPEVGDKYVLVDIKMPQSYITTAEQLLRDKAQSYLDENSVPRLTYGLEIDEKYIRDNGIALKVGNLVTVKDTALSIDNNIRVNEISYPLVAPARVSAIISDTIPYTLQERIIADTIDNHILTRDVDRRRAELTRKSSARMRQLQDLVFDPDGYFEAEKIKPSSIDTLMLSVGAKSQNFGLMGVSMHPNVGADPNKLNVSAGQLVHYELSIDGLGYIWVIDGQNFTSLDPGKPYYLYAKCSKTALTGIWELSEVPRVAEEVAGQYLFNLGILYPVSEGRRDFDFTNGMTFINGDRITTGSIKSLDGLTEMNLTEGYFKLGNNDYSLDWNVTTPGRLTIKGSLLQTAGGENITMPNYKGAYNATTDYFEGDLVSHSNNTYINLTPAATRGIAPPNATHWAIFSESGAQGPPGDVGPAIVYRGIFKSGIQLYNNSKRRDVVKHGSTYYLFKGQNGYTTTGSWVSSYWENFGAQFDSVATNLLLAENANIGDWVFKDGRLTSQNNKARLYGTTGTIIIEGTPVGSYDQNTRITGEGIMVTGKGLWVFQPVTEYNDDGEPIDSQSGYGARGSVVGKISSGGNSTSAKVAVYGVSNSNDRHNFGGLFSSLKSQGRAEFGGAMMFKTRRVSSSTTLTMNDCIIIVTAGAVITLPSSTFRDTGMTFWIKRATSSTVGVNGNGKTIYWKSPAGTIENIRSKGMTVMVTYDGTYWQYTEMFQ